MEKYLDNLLECLYSMSSIMALENISMTLFSKHIFKCRDRLRTNVKETRDIDK